jgi:hypothetical protein
MANLITLLLKFQADNKAYLDQLAQACTTANNGKAPTQDSNGRYHAPCNGYEYNGSIYLGGEYLSGEFTKNQGTSKAKVKIDYQLIDQIKAVWNCVSFGKSWSNNDGSMVCYAYFEALTQAQATALNSGITSSKKRMFLESDAIAQALDHGAVFKFNKRKYSNALRYSLTACELETSQDGINSSEWWIDNKTYKFSSKFDGQMVCFVYPSTKDYYTV